MNVIHEVSLSGYQIFGVWYTRGDIHDCGEYLEEVFEQDPLILGHRLTCEDHTLTVYIVLDPSLLESHTAESYVVSLVEGFTGIRDDEAAENEEDEE